MTQTAYPSVETPWFCNHVSGEKIWRFVDEAQGWSVGQFCIEATPYPYDSDKDAVYRVTCIEERADGDLIIRAQDVRFYSDSQFGRRCMHSPGFIGPFNSREEAIAAVAARNAREAA